MTLDETLAALRALAPAAGAERDRNLAGMARYGIDVSSAVGVPVPALRKLARRTGRDQPLAEALWDTGIREARILASLAGDPRLIARETMDRWAAESGSWEVCDACTGNLFRLSPHAWAAVKDWAPDEREFVRRAAFSLLAALAVHDRQAPDSRFLEGLDLIAQYSFDGRNFVRKAVNWALRNIGKRSRTLRPAAVETALRIRDQNTRAARWIASDALREFAVREPGK